MNATHPNAVSWFRDVGLDDRPTVGGKGASLGELIRAGATVPPGFCIGTAGFRTFLESVDPEGSIPRLVTALKGADHETLSRRCLDIQETITSGTIAEPLLTELVGAYQRLIADRPGQAVAVRSSATAEDNDDASFAGMQDTILWVLGQEALFAAVRKCWASLYSVESVSYRLRLDLPEDDVAMAVVVQVMVDARSAGVMFTRSPTTGDKSIVTVESTWGLGSAVVGGDVTPDRFSINKITGEIVTRQVSAKQIEHVPLEGRVVEVAVPADRRSAPSLSDEELLALVGIGKSVERHYGTAMDIEWAIDRNPAGGQSIRLLQARPETIWNNRDRDRASPVETNPAAHVLRTFTSRGRA